MTHQMFPRTVSEPFFLSVAWTRYRIRRRRDRTSEMPCLMSVRGPGRVADERNDAGASVATAMVGEDSMGPRSDRLGGRPRRRCVRLAESPAGRGRPAPDGNMSAVSPSLVEDVGRAGRRMVRSVMRIDPIAQQGRADGR